MRYDKDDSAVTLQWLPQLITLEKRIFTVMRFSLRKKIIEVCDKKIASKGEDVGVSFYAFFANKNDDPELLMEAAHWWIMEHKLDHFEKAKKIREMLVT